MKTYVLNKDMCIPWISLHQPMWSVSHEHAYVAIHVLVN